VYYCFIEVYTDGELQTHHAPFKERRLVEWFGSRDFGEGRFVKELSALRDGKRRMDGVDIVPLQDIYTAMLASNLATGEGPLPAGDLAKSVPSPVRIEGDKLYFGGNYGQGEYCEQLNRPVNSVLSLEPGIRAIHIIDEQLRLSLTNPISIFQYATISSYPFIARLLPHYLLCRSKQLTGSETLALTLEKQELYRSIQGEITDVTQNLIEGHQQRNQPYEFLDLVLYTSYLPSRLEVASARQAMKNVYRLLRPGGALLIGFPLIDAAPGNASITDLMDAAFSAGFLQEKARAHIGTSNMANARIPLFTLFVKEGG
jgi:hypothetical protein